MPKGKSTNPRHYWSNEELEWLRVNYPKYTQAELLTKFNEHHNTNFTLKSLRAVLKRYRIFSGRTGQWQKGQTAWNKGMKWDEYMSEEGQASSSKTWFVSDGSINNSNHNIVPIGTEALTGKDGYIVVKVNEPSGRKDRRCWKLKHHIIWEQAYGPIPKDQCVIFLDGNNRNFNLDNLALVNRAEINFMNAHNLYFKGNADATKCGISMTKIMILRSQYAKKQTDRFK